MTHFSPYWLSMKVLCHSTWCHMLVMHLFLPFYISMWCVSMSVIVLGRDGNTLRAGAVGPFLVLCPVSSFVSCTYVWWFLHGKDMSPFMWYTCCIYVTYFVRTWIMARWKVILSVWHPIRWRLLTWLRVSCTIKLCTVLYAKIY